MKYRTRIYYTDAQKALMWERWKEGWTLHQIAQLFNRPHNSVQGILSRTGGIRPPARSRCAWALTLAEREQISRAMVEGQSVRSVAAQLGRAPSTVSRELKRNGGRSNYRATEADGAAWDRALRPKHCKLVDNLALARIVTDKLRRLWSPEQIAGWLRQTYPRDESQHVSHETIYRSLFIQSRGALKRELLQHLRRTRGMRRSRHHTQKTDTHGQIVGAVSISDLQGAFGISNTYRGSGEQREEEATATQWTAWGRQAENAAAFLGKGSHVNIVGHLRNNHYQDAEGADVYGLSFTVDEIDYLDSKADAQARRERHAFIAEMDAADDPRPAAVKAQRPTAKA